MEASTSTAGHDITMDLFDEHMENLNRWMVEDGIYERLAFDSSLSDTPPPDESCPGIAYQFDVVPEHEQRFNSVVSILGPMLQVLHKINPQVTSSQLISLRPLVWVERFPNNEAMQSVVGPFLGRAHCVNDEHHKMVSTYVSGMRRIARLRHLVALGNLSEKTKNIVRGTAVVFGGLTTLRMLPVAHPAWVNRLVHSGEVVAMHSLSANSASDTTAIPGSRIAYTVRDVNGGSVVPLSLPFEYDVLAEFGCEAAGRAIAVRPRHAPHAVYICFRGVRRVGAETAHEADRRAVVSEAMERRVWLEELPRERKLHAANDDITARGGILEHHDGVYEASSTTATATTTPSESSVDVSDGTADAAATPAAPQPLPSLRAWLAQHASGAHGEMPSTYNSAAAALTPNHAFTFLDEVVFIGFSLGGALAQVTALHASIDFPQMSHRIRVLALGATQWASPNLSTIYAEIFGARAVHLLTAATNGEVAHGGIMQPPATEPPPGSSEPSTQQPTPPGSGASTPTHQHTASRALWSLEPSALIDPMTLGFTEETSYTHNLILCEAPPSTENHHSSSSSSAVPPPHYTGIIMPPAAAAAEPAVSPEAAAMTADRLFKREPSATATAAAAAAASTTAPAAASAAAEQPPAAAASERLLRPKTGAWVPPPPPQKAMPAAQQQGGKPMLSRRADRPSQKRYIRAQSSMPLASSQQQQANVSQQASEPSSNALVLHKVQRDLLGTLKRRTPNQAHERAYHSYWAGDLASHHPFATDVRKLHTGRAYRSALIREHTRLRSWVGGSAEGPSSTSTTSNTTTTTENDGGEGGAANEGGDSGGGGAIVGGGLPSSELPLVMSIDGAWECRAGVLYQVKHSRKFESGVRLVDAEPTPGVGTSIRRLRSVVSLEAMANSPSGAMDGVSTLMDELSMY